MKKQHFKITKRRRKKRETYKWLKVYFTDINFAIDDYCYEVREDFFLLPKKTEKYYIKVERTRNDRDRFKTYIYTDWEEITPSDFFKQEFKKSYEYYIFKLREKKLKRLI